MTLPVRTAVVAASAALVAFVGAAPSADAPARTGTGPDAALQGSSVSPAQAAEEYTLRGERVALYNPAGDVEVTRGSGTDVRVTVRRGGEDADRLSVATGHRHGRQTLRVRYPSDEFVYPGGEGSTTLRIADDGTFGHEGGRRVRVSDHGSGLRAHADLVVEVPEGQRLEIRIGLGSVSSRDAAADLSLGTSSGSVDVDGHRGDLEADTGSGSVTVSGAEGGVRVDTGSGSVRVSDVAGDLDADTGSGSIRAVGVRGGAIVLDTGNGDVEGEDLTGSDLDADTGSGDITLRRVSVPRLTLDTGSGSVRLGLLADVDHLEIDTGSGSVEVSVPADFGSRLAVATGSGDVDLSGLTASGLEVDDGDVSGAVGDGEGETTIDTGSGDVTVRRSGG